MPLIEDYPISELFVMVMAADCKQIAGVERRAGVASGHPHLF
jgi:hypothetical protein